MKVGILIPAYNESAQIKDVVETVQSMGFPAIVIDDGSKDNTVQEAQSGGAVVIRHEKNLGKGASIKTGFEYILKKGYDAALIMDGDGQHSPRDIHKFIDLASRYHNSLIIGSRMGDTKNMPIDRKLTNKFMSAIVSLICNQKIPDSQCGFRLLRRGLIEKIKIEYSRFEVESELLIKASDAGAKILSVPIETVYRNEASQINPIWDTFRFIIFLLKLPFKR